ncbi:hypothetical protein ACFX2I_045979 [Malus domestica]
MGNEEQETPAIADRIPISGEISSAIEQWRDRGEGGQLGQPQQVKEIKVFSTRWGIWMCTRFRIVPRGDDILEIIGTDFKFSRKNGFSRVGLNVATTEKKVKRQLSYRVRNRSKSKTNEDLLVEMSEKIGFEVEVLRPNSSTELAKIYWVLNLSDVVIGVQGATMTHFLFMRPGSMLIQVIPLGTSWAAEA